MKQFVTNCCVVFLPAIFYGLMFLYAIFFKSNEEQMWMMAGALMQMIWWGGFGVVAMLALIAIRAIILSVLGKENGRDKEV